MYRIALNTALSIFRKNKTIVEYKGSIPKDFHTSNSEKISENEEKMFEAIRTLNGAERAIVALYLEDYTYQLPSKIRTNGYFNFTDCFFIWWSYYFIFHLFN
jgi:DNA-directed RNA polymerase specialized sigma24 family protein